MHPFLQGVLDKLNGNDDATAFIDDQDANEIWGQDAAAGGTTIEFQAKQWAKSNDIYCKHTLDKADSLGFEFSN